MAKRGISAEAYSLALDVLENVMAVPWRCTTGCHAFFPDIFPIIQELGGMFHCIAERVERGYTGYIYAKVHLDNGRNGKLKKDPD